MVIEKYLIYVLQMNTRLKILQLHIHDKEITKIDNYNKKQKISNQQPCKK